MHILMGNNDENMRNTTEQNVRGRIIPSVYFHTIKVRNVSFVRNTRFTLIINAIWRALFICATKRTSKFLSIKLNIFYACSK